MIKRRTLSKICWARLEHWWGNFFTGETHAAPVKQLINALKRAFRGHSAHEAAAHKCNPLFLIRHTHLSWVRQLAVLECDSVPGWLWCSVGRGSLWCRSAARWSPPDLPGLPGSYDDLAVPWWASLPPAFPDPPHSYWHRLTFHKVEM